MRGRERSWGDGRGAGGLRRPWRGAELPVRSREAGGAAHASRSPDLSAVFRDGLRAHASRGEEGAATPDSRGAERRDSDPFAWDATVRGPRTSWWGNLEPQGSLPLTTP